MYDVLDINSLEDTFHYYFLHENGNANFIMINPMILCPCDQSSIHTDFVKSMVKDKKC
jgi:hypothetical protein